MRYRATTQLVAVGLALAATHAGGQAAASDVRSHAVVTAVTDGDTVDVALHGREQAVRLIGIDTPEVFFGGWAQPSGYT